ncbi:MAG: AmmeMemoRadiSam system protein A [Phycisphaerae bacterium]
MPIGPAEREQLLTLARQALTAKIYGRPLPHFAHPEGILAEKRGCFVTLTNKKQLRGCIGNFLPKLRLAEEVIEMTLAAAEDPRFFADPITPGEVDELTIEISVLSPLEKTDNPLDEIKIGEHGIYIVRGGQAGCFLPEVATDQGWSTEEFLCYCCAHKARLPADAWTQTDTNVFLFTTEKFSD